MSDPEHASDDEARLDPGQEARLRRLLAAARHDEPVPDDVAARLDRVLAGLREETSDDEEPPLDAASHPPDDLAARRRLVTRWLLAAAAFVVVAGVGVHVLRDGPTVSDQEDSTSSPSAVSSSAASGDSASGDAARGETFAQDAPEANGSSKQSGASPVPGSAPYAALPQRGLPRLTDAGFSRQVRALVRVAGPENSTTSADAAAGRCRVPARVGDGSARTLSVLYRGAPAALVVRPPQGQSQVVDLVRCGSAQVLRSVTLAR